MTEVFLLDAARRLCEVLEEENLALSAMDIVKANALVGRKQAAVDALLAARDLIPTVPADEWAKIGRRLALLVQANKKLLERAMIAQDRIIACIARAITRAMPPVAAYGAQGSPAQRRGLPPMALSNSAREVRSGMWIGWPLCVRPLCVRRSGSTSD
jgi:hypothetical protein